ncbi:MAG: translation initiation factor IF-3 [Clostridia bacterium]|nr:translation initiation factor IF-3 [Clostridia bacterium]
MKSKTMYGRCTIIKKTEINEEIRDREVRLIDENGDQLGVVPIAKALELAEERERDLVKIAPGAKPPVCKIMDYGKHKYEQAKRDKDARKKQKTQQVKEIRLSLNIEENDIKTKAKNAAKFLQGGDKLKVSLRFRGRELGHTNLGYAVFDKFAAEIEEFGTMEQRPKMEGRSMNASFVPKK